MAYSSAEELTLIHSVLDEITIELKSTVKNGNFKTENGKIVKSLLDEFSKGMLDRLVKIVDEKIKAGSGTQGFQSGPVPGTFTRLRSCIVPAEITEPPPPKIAVVKTTSTIGLWNIFHKKLMITSIAEFSHSNQQLRHDQVDGIFPVLKITLP